MIYHLFRHYVVKHPETFHHPSQREILDQSADQMDDQSLGHSGYHPTVDGVEVAKWNLHVADILKTIAVRINKDNV